MIRYFDTSALLKRYVREAGSAEVERLLRQHVAAATSRLALVEATAAFGRLVRERILTSAARTSYLSDLRRDMTFMDLVNVENELIAAAAALCARHPLRAYDAVHLASALQIGAEVDSEVTFVCSDLALTRVARALGLATVVPGEA